MDCRRAFLFSGFIALFAAGCGGSDTETSGSTDTTTDTGNGTFDARVAVPDPDPAYYDVVSPEVTIESGEDKMLCYHMVIDEEIVADNMEAYQGKFGHHIVVLTAREPQPPGTLEDCTDRKAMTKYGAFMLPDTQLNPGYGLLIPKGSQVVMQIHYINAGAEPELVRDVGRIHKISKDSVTKWVHTMATSDNTLTLPPHQKTHIEFDCEVPAGTELLVAGGHMHERGTRFEMLLGKDAATLESLYLVDPWKTEFRDAPPVSLYFDNPKLIADKSILRTSCDWNNETANELIFPEEMCATFGYVAGTDAPLECQINLK